MIFLMSFSQREQMKQSIQNDATVYRQLHLAGRSIGRALGNMHRIKKRAWKAILRTSKNVLLNSLWGSGRSFLACYTNCITGEH